MIHVNNFSNGALNPVLSYVMSCVGCFLGLRCTTRARAYRGAARARWLTLAALSIATTGIWVMHFIAMLGFTIPGQTIRYNVPITILSMVIAVIVVGIGVFIVGFSRRAGNGPLVLGGTILGLGVASMHYLGMGAVRVQASLTYDPALVTASVVIAVIEFLWDGWRPHSAVLGRPEGVEGYHDITRYPGARLIPGLVLFRWDAPLFFANAELFKERVLAAAVGSPTPVRWLVVAAEPVTSVDITAADALVELDEELRKAGIDLCFAELKDPVKDKLRRFGLLERFGEGFLFPTVEAAVDLVDDRRGAVATPQEVCMQGVHHASRDGGRCRRQRLSEDLAPEHLRAADIAARAAKQVHLQLLELEQLQKIRQALIHERAASLLQPNLKVPCMSAL